MIAFLFHKTLSKNLLRFLRNNKNKVSTMWKSSGRDLLSGYLSSDSHQQSQVIIVQPAENPDAVVEFVPMSASDDLEATGVASSSHDTHRSSIQAEPLSSFVRFRKNFIFSVTPFIGALTTISVPIFAIYIQGESTKNLPQKICVPLLSWIIIASCSTWLQNNGIAARADGRIDEPILHINEVNADKFEHDSLHVFIALVANLATVTNAMLVMLAVLPSILKTNNPGLLWSLIVFCGVLNGLLNLYTDVASAFRKHVEYHHRHGRNIHALFNQRLFKPFADNAYYCAIFIREFYPMINALVRTQASVQLLQKVFVAAKMSDAAIKLISLVAGYLIYSASAFTVTHFDVAQLTENLASIKCHVEVRNSLSQSSYCGMNFVGRLISGQLLFDAFKKMSGSNCISVDILMLLNAFGLMALTKRGLTHYVSSNDAIAVEKSEQGILISYIAGNKNAVYYGEKLSGIFWGGASALSVVESGVKRSMVQKRVTEEDRDQHRVQPMG